MSEERAEYRTDGRDGTGGTDGTDKTGDGTVEMYKTVTRAEYARMRRIADAAFGCLGFLDAAGQTDRTRADFIETVEQVKEKLEEAVKREVANG